jgi:pimeloyl-ACP methyl ester carboxylesterase
MSEHVRIRVHGPDSLPTLIYLPGIHGNWMLVGGFRRALAGRVRFVEFSYPNTLTWTLEEHAAAVEAALADQGVTGGWLLGESFSSQVAWALLVRNKFPVNGLILAGGFVRHPWRWAVRLAQYVFSDSSFSILSRVFCLYAWVTPFRFRKSPETYQEIRDFIAGLTPRDFQCFKHRLALILQNDPSPIARQTPVPVHALTGLFDPVVPWPWVRHWLRKHCPALRQYRVIARADHNVLGTAPVAAAEQVLKWMDEAHPSAILNAL